jgi:hypothetical protein
VFIQRKDGTRCERNEEEREVRKITVPRLKIQNK